MPLYDIQCSACGIFEVFQTMEAKQPTQCPICKKKIAYRIFLQPPKAHIRCEDGNPRKGKGRG